MADRTEVAWASEPLQVSLLLVEGENGGAASVIVQERRRVTVAHHRSRVGFSHLGLVDGSQPIHVRSATDPYSTLFTEIRIERSPELQSRGATPVPAHLAGFLHKRVALDTTTGTLEGELLSLDGGVTIQTASGLEFIPAPPLGSVQIRSIRLVEAASQQVEEDRGLVAVTGVLESNSTGEHLIDLLYHTSGIECDVSYSLVIDDEEDHFHFCGKYRVRNATKMHFPAAVVSIRKPKAQVISSAQIVQSSSWSTSFSGPLLQQHSSASASDLASTLFFVVQINNGNPIEIAPSSEVDFTFTQGMVCPINLHYLFEATPEHRFEDHLVEDQEFGRRSRSAVLQGVLEVPNLDEHGLGLPLPRGQALIHYVSSNAAQKALAKQTASSVFTSVHQTYRTVMPATSIGEVMQIRLGPAKGLTGERRATNLKRDDSKRSLIETVSLTVTNYHRIPATIVVEDCLYRWPMWKITRSSKPYHANGKDRIRWVLMSVPVGSKETIEYTAHYSWEQIEVKITTDAEPNTASGSGGTKEAPAASAASQPAAAGGVPPATDQSAPGALAETETPPRTSTDQRETASSSSTTLFSRLFSKSSGTQ